MANTAMQDPEISKLSLQQSDSSIVGVRSDTEIVPSLQYLPAELIWHTASFLDSKFISDSMSEVCMNFNNLFNDTKYWRSRMKKRWPKPYPAVQSDGDHLNWRKACVEREEQTKLWSNASQKADYYKFTAGLYAPVDTVHFVGDGHFLAAGSRDRYINVLDLNKIDQHDEESLQKCRTFCKVDAHKGWIWSMSSQGNTLATGSWDRYVKLWDLSAGGAEVLKSKCSSAVLCTVYEPGSIIAGCFDKTIFRFDPRSGRMQKKKRYHGRPVLSLAVDDRHIISASEDKTISVYDRRADKVLRTITFEYFPLSMSYDQNQLWVGDKMGGLHLVDATNGLFELVESYQDIHRGKITGISHEIGALFTCSTDKTLKVHHPTRKPDVITTLDNFRADIADLAHKNNILACACSDSSIGIWIPKKSVDEASDANN